MKKRIASRITTAIACAGAALVTTAFAQGGKAQGTVTVDAEKITIASVSAVTYKGAQGQLVSVLLSDRPADPKAFAENTRAGAGDGVPGVFSGAWKSQHFGKRFSGLTFTFSEKGQIVDEELLVGGRNKTFSIGGDEYVLDLTSRAPQIAGRIRTKTPVVDVGRKVGVDVRFEVQAAPAK